jgi:glycosyltransferase involved in cell wall biosynthesis
LPRPLSPISKPWAGPRPKVTVIILTLNEEANITACLESCAWSDDVHIVDSGSRDRTVELAEHLGASVHRHAFRSFADQRNWAIDHVPARHDWVFHLDADERFTPELVGEIDRVLGGGPAEAGFYVANQLIFMGRWIRRASGYPAYQMRLFHRRRMRFVDHGHGQREDGRGAVGTLDSPYLHYNFAKGLDDWYERHNRYSAEEVRRILASPPGAVRLRGLLGRDPVARRRALKEAAAHVPFRPMLRRLHALVLRGAILEGEAGRTYAALLGAYEQMIQLKLRAARDRSSP